MFFKKIWSKRYDISIVILWIIAFLLILIFLYGFYLTCNFLLLAPVGVMVAAYMASVAAIKTIRNSKEAEKRKDLKELSVKYTAVKARIIGSKTFVQKMMNQKFDSSNHIIPTDLYTNLVDHYKDAAAYFKDSEKHSLLPERTVNLLWEIGEKFDTVYSYILARNVFSDPTKLLLKITQQNSSLETASDDFKQGLHSGIEQLNQYIVENSKSIDSLLTRIHELLAFEHELIKVDLEKL